MAAHAEEKKFVPVMITPFDQRMQIDMDGLCRLIDFYLAAGVKGFFANCLSSEMFSITEAERIALVKEVVRYVGGAVPVVATGSFGATIEEKAAFIEKIYRTGLNGVILITGHLAGPNDSEELLWQNTEKLFALTGKIPLGLYECPAPYKRILSPALFERLLSSSRLVYHKDTSLVLENVQAKLDVLKKTKNEKLEFYDAHTPHAMRSLQMGARGLSAIAGNFYPEIMVWMCKHAADPDKEKEVFWLQSQLNRADPLLHEAYPLSAKYFLKKRGIPIEPFSRTWVYSLTREQQKTLDNIYLDFLSWCDRLKIKPVT